MKLQSALDMAARGFRVFPIAVNSKRPAFDGWQQKATTDKTQIESWWSDNPEYNIGVATGGGTIVVDADVKKGAKGLASLDVLDMLGLPESLRVATPSGGMHVYLLVDRQHRNRVGTIKDFPGIDIRSDGGYVLGPGSTVDGLRYAISIDHQIAQSPVWFEDTLQQSAAEHKMADSGSQPLVELDRPENIASAIEYLTNRAPEAIEGAGGDQTTFTVACRVRDYGVSEETAQELLLEHWNEANASPPWLPDELATKVANAFSYATGSWGGQTAAGEFGVVEGDMGDAPDIGKPTSPEAGHTEHKAIVATAYQWADPASIPRREWVFGRHLIRKFVSVTVAPGNIGKSSLTIAEALSMASGKPILGVHIDEPLRVWYWNLEDPYDELQRRIQAAAQFYGLTPADIGDRLFVNSGRQHPLRMAIADKNGARVVRPVIEGVVSEMLANRIDVLSVDPFVSSHGVPENDNLAIDMVAKEWGRVADRANAAVDLIHHTRKQLDAEVSVESSRGGKALTDAAREVRVLNRMTKEEAAKVGIDNHRLYFRTYSDKANMAPPADRSEWWRLNGVELANGDDVGVVSPWEWPDPFQDITNDHIRRVQEMVDGKEFRESVLAKDWVGKVVGEVAGLDPTDIHEREKIKTIVREWIDKGFLAVRKMKDEKGKDRPIVEVGRRLQDTDFGEFE